MLKSRIDFCCDVTEFAMPIIFFVSVRNTKISKSIITYIIVYHQCIYCFASEEKGNRNVVYFMSHIWDSIEITFYNKINLYRKIDLNVYKQVKYLYPGSNWSCACYYPNEMNNNLDNIDLQWSLSKIDHFCRINQFSGFFFFSLTWNLEC